MIAPTPTGNDWPACRLQRLDPGEHPPPSVCSSVFSACAPVQFLRSQPVLDRVSATIWVSVLTKNARAHVTCAICLQSGSLHRSVTESITFIAPIPLRYVWMRQPSVFTPSAKDMNIDRVQTGSHIPFSFPLPAELFLELHTALPAFFQTHSRSFPGSNPSSSARAPCPIGELSFFLFFFFFSLADLRGAELAQCVTRCNPR